MKIIELLNRIANGEEVPKKIKFDDIIFEYDGDYYSSETNALLEGYCYLTTSILNNEVEVIEENNDVNVANTIIFDLQDRIDKAIKYIEERYHIKGTMTYDSPIYHKDLLDILKGSE